MPTATLDPLLPSPACAAGAVQAEGEGRGACAHCALEAGLGRRCIHREPPRAARALLPAAPAGKLLAGAARMHVLLARRGIRNSLGQTDEERLKL